MHNTHYVVRISAAHMPSSCKGRYQHVAVMAVEPGHTPKMIKNTSKQRVVQKWSKRSVGRTERCALRRAVRAAEALADQLNSEIVGVPV